MRLKRPFITIMLIILLVLNLIFFSFVFMSRTVTNKEYIKEIIYKFDIRSYLNDNEDIKQNVDKYKYPIEVFDYIDEKSFKEILLNKLYDDKDYDLKVELTNMFKKSIDKYDSLNNTDSYNYVCDDIESIVNKFSEYFDEYVLKTFNFIRFISNNSIFYFSIILSIVICGIIVFVERGNGILITSIILFLYSLFCYYINSNYYSIIVSAIGRSKNFEYLKNYSFLLDKVYIICFILSFVLLLIYIIIFVRKKIKNRKMYLYQ